MCCNVSPDILHVTHMQYIALFGVLVVSVFALIGLRMQSTEPLSSDAVTDARTPQQGSEASQPLPNTPKSSGSNILDTADSPVPSAGDYANQDLTSVPKGIFNQTSLTGLDLSHNALSGALPAEVRHLSKLRTLDLSHNNFTGVPAEIGQLSQLEVLDLSYNPITGLPYELGNLKNLKTLDLRGTNYVTADLAIIQAALSAQVVILTD